MKALRPPEIVRALDEHITGQQRAKRSIAVAIRNRWRTQQAGVANVDDLAMYRFTVAGPRGTGKTRIVRHAAQAVEAPFTRVSFPQLAAAGSTSQATEYAFESLVEAARRQAHAADLDAAILEAETSGIILIDGLDRWLHGGDGPLDDPLSTAQKALYGLAAGGQVDTRYGRLRTRDIMLFIAGDLTAARPADVPEDVQVLFPRRIELDALEPDDLLQLLLRPSDSPIGDYVALLRTEGLQLEFTRDGIEALAAEASDLNRRIEDTGAHRLTEVLEIVLDDLLFDDASASKPAVTIDAAYVASRLAAEKDEEDLDDFIL